jgi:hypothetical protein
VGQSEADRSAGFDQGGIRDASGPNRGPYCPKSRRRDGGAGEAVTLPVAVIRRTTREGHELDRKTEKRLPKEMAGSRWRREMFPPPKRLNGLNVSWDSGCRTNRPFRRLGRR